MSMNYTKGKWIRLRDSSIIAEGKLNDGFVISDCYGPDADSNSTLISSAPDLLEALEKAKQFIENGIELGYIRMPDEETPDSAHKTLPMIIAAIKKARGQ